MIFDKINTSISKMQEFRRQKEMKDNAAQQEITDRKYQDLSRKVHEFLEALHYVSVNLKFQVPEVALLGTQILLEKMERVIDNGFADADKLADADKQYKSVYGEVRKDWKLHFAFLTRSKISTLNVIRSIDSEKADLALDRISAAEEWSNNISVYEDLNKALIQTDELILNLNMSKDIVDFLKKMNMGKATLEDLDSTVMEWIRGEQLTSKIRLQFVLK